MKDTDVDSGAGSGPPQVRAYYKATSNTGKPSVMRFQRSTPARVASALHELIDPERGFLAAPDPVLSLPASFAAVEELAGRLASVLRDGEIRRQVHLLPVPDVSTLDDCSRERAMMLYSFIGQAYVWGEPEQVSVLPPGLARPWHALAKLLHRHPILSYPSSVLNNWRRLDRTRPIEMGNVIPLQTFLDSPDERWFFALHVCIEGTAGPILRAIADFIVSGAEQRRAIIVPVLTEISHSLLKMVSLMRALPEKTDPPFYFQKVRPFLHGWKDNPALPAGLVYAGVNEYAGAPRQFRGETAAQSVIIPALDAFLGVTHAEDPLRIYLTELRDYMNPAQRLFLESVEKTSSARNYITEEGRPGELVDSFNGGIEALREFRARHLGLTMRYIVQHSGGFATGEATPPNANSRGTAGTPFLPYLKKHLDETVAAAL